MYKINQDTAKKLLVGKDYNRAIFNTTLDAEGDETYSFISSVKDKMNGKNAYIIGDSPMALEMSESFDGEMNLITVLTMIFIFVVVAFTFKSILIPIILVLLILTIIYHFSGFVAGTMLILYTMLSFLVFYLI